VIFRDENPLGIDAPFDIIEANGNRIRPTSGVIVRPFSFSAPVGSTDPSAVFTAGEQTASVPLPQVPAAVAGAAVVTSNDASVPGFAAVTLAGFGGLPTSLQLLIVLVGLWLIYRWTK
jgi:hypothetical protein